MHPDKASRLSADSRQGYTFFFFPKCRVLENSVNPFACNIIIVCFRIVKRMKPLFIKLPQRIFLWKFLRFLWGYGGIVLADVNAAKLSLKTSMYLHSTGNYFPFYTTACPVCNNFSVSRWLPQPHRNMPFFPRTMPFAPRRQTTNISSEVLYDSPFQTVFLP